MAFACLSGIRLVPLSPSVIKHRQNRIGGYKEQKTNMKLQTHLLASSLQAEEIKEGMGAVDFSFSFLFLDFRICQSKRML